MGQLLAAQAGMHRLDDLRREGILLDKIWQSLHADYIETRSSLTEEMDHLFANHAELERELLIQARREALQAGRAALMDAFRQGLLSDEVFGELRTDIDRRLEAMALIEAAVQSRQLPRQGEGE